MIMGMEQADSGTFQVGETVKVGYVDQVHSNIDPEKTVFQTISKWKQKALKRIDWLRLLLREEIEM